MSELTSFQQAADATVGLAITLGLPQEKSQEFLNQFEAILSHYERDTKHPLDDFKHRVDHQPENKTEIYFIPKRETQGILKGVFKNGKAWHQGQGYDFSFWSPVEKPAVAEEDQEAELVIEDPTGTGLVVVPDTAVTIDAVPAETKKEEPEVVIEGAAAQQEEPEVVEPGSGAPHVVVGPDAAAVTSDETPKSVTVAATDAEAAAATAETAKPAAKERKPKNTNPKPGKNQTPINDIP